MKNSREKRNRKEKGITLIAVVVSLVILIILALIGIRIAFNDDGVFNSAEKSTEVQSNSIIKEREDANSYVTEIEDNSELKLAVEQKEISTPVSDGQYSKGEEIKYEVTITNTGEKNLVDLELTDIITRPDRTEGQPSGLPGGTTVIDRLEVDESKTIPIAHIVEDKDLGGNLKNTVKVIGYAEDNPKESAEAVSKVTVATVSLNENLTIEKARVNEPANGKAYMVGEKIEYLITVTNVGTKTVSNIIVDDTLTAIDKNGNVEEREKWEFKTLYEDKENKTEIKPRGTLEAGKRGYIKYSYLITSEDLGKTLSNEARVRGKTKIPTGEKPVETPIDVPTGTLTITKAYYGVEGIWTGAEFKITLRDKTGKELTDQYPYYRGNIESGTITSGELFKLDNGEGYTIVGLPDGTKFTIQEIKAPDGFNLDPEIKEGTIDLSKSLAESVSFMNYQTTALPSTGGGTIVQYSSERKISLTVDSPSASVSEEDLMQLKEKLELRFYYIAELSLEKPVYNILEKYKSIGILQKLSGSSIDALEWRAMAVAIEKCILENGIEADFTLRDGETIQDYRDGLYLILCDDVYTNQYIYKGMYMEMSEWGDYRNSGTLITTYGKEYIEDGVYGDWMGPGLEMTSIGGGEIFPRQGGSLEIINTVNSCNTNSAAPIIYEVKGIINGEIVYSNIVSIDITEAGQHPINILGEIPTGAEVTVRCIYGGVYQLMTEPEQTVLVDNPDEKPSVNFTYEYNRDCKTITSTTHSFINGEEWQWSKDKEESIGYGMGVEIALNEEFNSWTIHNIIDATENSDEVYIRVKAFAPEGINLSCSSNSEQWQMGEDGYWYYSSILVNGSSTEILDVGLENINEDTANFNVAVIVEAAKVQYDDAGNPYVDWNATIDTENEGGA